VTPEGRAEGLRDLLGERLFLAVAGNDALISIGLRIAVSMTNARDREFTRLWFAAPCDALDGNAPIEVLATAESVDLERVTAVLLAAANETLQK